MKTARSQRWLLAGVPLVGILFLASPLVSSRLDVNDYEGGASRDLRARAERNSRQAGWWLRRASRVA
jgi:hypothetical protein